MKIETIKALVISTSHITKEDGARLFDRSYTASVDGVPLPFQFTPATDEYGHWIWVGALDEEASLECQCASADDEGYSAYFTDILRLAHKNGCSYVRFDRDGPTYEELATLAW